MKEQKSLGQIVYEAHKKFAAEYGPWRHLWPEEKAIHEEMARAVAEECAREAEDAISNGVVVLSAREVGDFIRSRAGMKRGIVK